MTISMRPRILFVDDEPHVLDALRRQLRDSFIVQTAQSGAAGLALLESEDPFSVIVSDMQMPGMNGATFLRHARERSPDSVRLLLTGHADVDAAIDAVNDGHVFRFLRKPCPPAVLQPALASAVDQHRLVTSERELLERTLRGSIDALSETLALVSPLAFGAAMRTRKMAAEIAAVMAIPDAWTIEVAATMSRLGAVTLHDSLVEKMATTIELTPSEALLVAELPAIAERLLAKIPRLEGVREIIAAENAHFNGSGAPSLKGDQIPIGARILKLARDFDALEHEGNHEAIATLVLRQGLYDPRVVSALAAALEGRATAQLSTVTIDGLRVGMVFAADVVLTSGVLLIARGLPVTESLLARMRNYRPSMKTEQISVHLHRP